MVVRFGLRLGVNWGILARIFSVGSMPGKEH